MPDKHGGKSPKWIQTLKFANVEPAAAPKLRLTLLDKQRIGKDEVIGEGQFVLAPAYANPYVPDNRLIDIFNNGRIVAKIMCFIEYQGNVVGNQPYPYNNTQMNIDMRNVPVNAYIPTNQTYTAPVASNMSNISTVTNRSGIYSSENGNSGIRYRQASPNIYEYKNQVIGNPVPVHTVQVPVYIVKQVPVVTTGSPLANMHVNRQSYNPLQIRTERVPLGIMPTSLVNTPGTTTRHVYVTPQKYIATGGTTVRLRENLVSKSPSFGKNSGEL